MNEAPEVKARHIDLEGLFDLKGKSLDQVLFAMQVPSVASKSVAAAVQLAHKKTLEIAADTSRSAQLLTTLLKSTIRRNYEEMCRKIAELRDRDGFDAGIREPLPEFESVYSRITVANFDLIVLLQKALRHELSLVYGVNLTNADFIYLSQRWGNILTCDALLKEMLLPVDQRKHILAILLPSTNSVSAIVEKPSAASRLRAPTVAGPQMPPPLPSAQTTERLVGRPATHLRAPTLAGPVLSGTKPPDLPFAREQTRRWTRPGDGDAAVEIKAETKTTDAVPIALPVEEKAAPSTVLPTAGVTPVVDGSAGPTTTGLPFDREQTRPWIPSDRLGKVPVEKDIDPSVTDSAVMGGTALVDRAPSVHSIGEASTATPAIPTRPHAWREHAPALGAVGALGVILGLGLSLLTKSKQREQVVVSLPPALEHPPMESRSPVTPQVIPPTPVIPDHIPEAPVHIPVVPYTPGMEASVATAIRRSLIANHRQTLRCVPGNGAKREMDFRYFLDAVTHIAANQSPLVRSWRLVGNVSTYTTTLDSIASDCRSFAFTLYRGTSVVVPSTRVTFVTPPADLIAARRGSGRTPTPLPVHVPINFAQ